MVVGGTSLVAWLSVALNVRRWRAQLLSSFRRRAEAEDDLRRAHAELEVRVKERTAELARANEALQAENSERKQAEEALRASQQIIEGIINVIPARVFWKDKNLVYLGCNAAFAHDAGFADPRDIIGKDDYQMAWRDRAELYRSDDSQVIESGCSKLLIEEPLTTPEGNVVTILTSKVPLCSSTGQISGVIGTFMDITERKRADDLFRLSEERFRIAAETANDVIYEWDLKQNLEWLGKIDDLLGYEPGEFPRTMDGFAAAVHPEDLERTMAAIQAHLEGRGPYAIEYRVRRKDGVYRWWSARGAVARTPEGNPTRWIGSITDITERKETEIALMKLAAIVESSNDAIIGKDLNGNIVNWNKGAEKLFGYTAGEMTGTSVLRLIPADKQEEENQILKRIKRRESVESFETVRQAKDGRLIDVAITASPIKDPTGQIIGMSKVARDITERKRAEEELKRSQSRLADAQRIARVGSWDWDLVTGKLSWSDQFFRLLGFEPREIEPSHGRYLACVHPDDRKAAEQLLEDVLATQKPASADVRIVHPNGEVRILQTQARVIVDDSGKVVRRVGTMQDVTEVRQKERELLLAKSAAETATKVKSEFLASMSHEIRTPMNGVIGMTNLLLDSDLSGDQRHYAEAISKSGESLLSVINDILDFSKIEAGKLTFETLDFDLHEAVEGCLELLAQRAQGKGLELASLIESNVPVQLRGDPGRLRQVLTNLVSNAIKFTERGEVVVKVSLEKQTDTDALVRFEVKDTGIGIAAETKEHLFQPFRQADASMSRKFGGTGLGLAISKDLVEIMKGEVGVESAVGKGSTFWFTARLALQSESSESRSAIGSVATGAAGQARKVSPPLNLSARADQKLRVLLAEDNIVNQEVAQGQLHKLGYQADVVADGNEVLEALRRSRYNVILMDCQMPELDGYETTGRIRQFEQQRIKPFDWKAPIHIIAMTAHAMRGDREKCLTAGMNDYLSKPVRQDELKAALERCSASEANPSASGVAAAPEDGLASQKIVSAVANGSSSGELMVDIDRLRDVTDNEPARMRRLINIYLAQTAPMLDELGAAIQSNSSEETARLAHKLVGSSISCGVEAFTLPLRELEQLGRRGDLSQANALFDDVRDKFPRVQRAFDDVLQGIPISNSCV